MILSGQSIARLNIIRPTVVRTREFGMTYGLGPAGYDVRIEFGLNDKGSHYPKDPNGYVESDDDIYIPEYIPYKTLKQGQFSLASTMEKFHMPKDVVGIVHDKSTWARRGIAVQNTVIEPGWNGYLTLEITNHGHENITIMRGMPIAQIIFHKTDEPTFGYDGKYQNQERGPQEARYDK